MSSNNPFENVDLTGLPEEVLGLIIDNLDPISILKLGEVNHQFSRLATDNFIWQKKVKIHFPETWKAMQTTDHRVNWRINWLEIFRQQHLLEYSDKAIKHLIPYFMRVKEGDYDGWLSLQDKQPLDMAGMLAEDKNGTSLFEWALFKGETSILTHMYKSIVSDPSKSSRIWHSKKGNTLYFAIFCRQPMADIEKLLSDGASINALSMDNMTPLMRAACLGQIDTIKWLLEKGAEVDRQAADGSTALMYASFYGHADAVKLLLDNGASFGKVLKEMWSFAAKRSTKSSASLSNRYNALDIAVMQNYPDVIEIIVDHARKKLELEGCVLDLTTPTLIAVFSGNTQALDKLKAMGAKTDELSEANHYARYLMQAINLERIDAVRRLLEVGEEKWHFFAIQKAIKLNREAMLSNDMLIKLLENAPHYILYEALRHALRNNCFKQAQDIILIIKTNKFRVSYSLEEQSAWPEWIKVTSSCYFNDTPLHIAAKKPSGDLIKSLLEDATAEIDAVRAGYTPLMFAAKNVDIATARLLLDKGANPNFEGENALMYACINPFEIKLPEFIKLFNPELNPAIKLDHDFGRKALIEIIKAADFQVSYKAIFWGSPEMDSLWKNIIALLDIPGCIDDIKKEGLSEKKNRKPYITACDAILCKRQFLPLACIIYRAKTDQDYKVIPKPRVSAKLSDYQLKSNLTYLDHYFEETRQRIVSKGKDHHKTAIRFFDGPTLVNFGYSAAEKGEAAKFLLDYVYGVRDASAATPEIMDALNNGRLQTIYNALLPEGIPVSKSPSIWDRLFG